MSILNFFNFNPKPKTLVTMYFKSGNLIEVLCDSINVTKDGNELIGYEIFGKNTKRLMYVRLSEVEAIHYRNI